MRSGLTGSLELRYNDQMLEGSIEHQLKFQKLVWLVVILLGAAACGFALATNSYLLAVAALGGIWLLSIPYHTTLSMYLAVATFSSALIMPLFPGRPYVWEFAALLGWSGITLSVFMRRYVPDFSHEIRENKWLFVGLVGYLVVLVATMFIRGFGLRILGSAQMGGRYYFQQIACAIFPWLFVLRPLNEKTLIRLLTLQCLLTTTFLITDFVLALASERLYIIFQFFELSGDAANFEIRAMRFGIRRFQSLYTVGVGLFCVLLIYFNLRDFLTRKGALLLPVLATVMGVALLSGHRYLVVITTGVAITCAVAQRFFTLRQVTLSLLPIAMGLFVIYAFSERLPLAAQRTVSFLPGIRVDSTAYADAANTVDLRRILARIGIQMIPTYFWAGRGFSVQAQEFSGQWDPTGVTGHLAQGRFYNGFIGLMINTGVFGAASMLLFMLGGTLIAFRIIRYLRQYGCEDNFSRLCSVLAGLWLANSLAFLFLHGDSEYAMKTFSLQAGLLLGCHYLLKRRLENAAAEPVSPS